MTMAGQGAIIPSPRVLKQCPIELNMTTADLFMFFKGFDVVITDYGQSWPDEVVQYEYQE